MIYYIKNKKGNGDGENDAKDENEELKKKNSGKKNVSITRGEFKEFYVEQK